MVSAYSVVSSVLFYNLGLLILFVLRRKTDFIARYAISTLLLLSVLSLVRLLVPIDLDAAYVIESHVILPKLIEILEYKPGFWPLNIGHTLAAIWLIGTLTHGIKICRVEYVSYRYRRIYPKIRSEQLKRVSARLDREYNIIISPKVSQPYTTGIIKPIIYLPYIKYTDEQMYYILLHEVQHIKSRDNLNRMFLLILESIFWWNQLAHFAVDDFELLTEYNCDAKVTAQLDECTVKDYLSTIVSVSGKLNPDEDKAKPKLALMFAQTDDIIQRFEVLLRTNDCRPKRIRYAVWLLMLVLFVMSYFVIIQPYYSAPTVFSDIEIPVAQENSYIVVIDGTYYLVVNDIDFHVIDKLDLNYPPFNDLMIIGE